MPTRLKKGKKDEKTPKSKKSAAGKAGRRAALDSRRSTGSKKTDSAQKRRRRKTVGQNEERSSDLSPKMARSRSKKKITFEDEKKSIKQRTKSSVVSGSKKKVRRKKSVRLQVASPSKKAKRKVESAYTTRESTPMGGIDENSSASSKSAVATVDENLEIDLENDLSLITAAYIDGLDEADDAVYENNGEESESNDKYPAGFKKPANMWRKIQASLANYSSEDNLSINKTLAKEKDIKSESSHSDPEINFSSPKKRWSEITLPHNAKQIMQALEARELSLELSAEGQSPSPMMRDVRKIEIRKEKEIIFGTPLNKTTEKQFMNGLNSHVTRDIERKSSVDASRNLIINIEPADDESSPLDDTFDVVAEALREIERSRNTTPRKPGSILNTVNDGRQKTLNLKQKNEANGSLAALQEPLEALGTNWIDDIDPNRHEIHKEESKEINSIKKRITWPERSKDKIRDDPTSYRRINRSISMARITVHENKESKRNEIVRRSTLPMNKKAIHENIATGSKDSVRYPENLNNHKAVQSDAIERDEIERLYDKANDNPHQCSREFLVEENKQLKRRLRKLKATIKSPNVHLRRLLKKQLADGEQVHEIMVERKQKDSLTVTMKLTAVFEVDD